MCEKKNSGTLQTLMHKQYDMPSLCVSRHLIFALNKTMIFFGNFQLSFSFGLLPSILLTYIGQAAYLRKHPEHFADTFYRSVPSKNKLYNALFI
jgi:hypothetical protein